MIHIITKHPQVQHPQLLSAFMSYSNNPDTCLITDKDKQLNRIEEHIYQKRMLLFNKQKYLEETAKENRFLERVYKDYHKYNKFIVEEREKQLRAMKVISGYLDKITHDGKLTDDDIAHSKREQREIIDEITKIKNGLDEIVDADKLVTSDKLVV